MSIPNVSAAIDFAKKYSDIAIPGKGAGEASYWSISAVPGGQITKRPFTVFRFNMNWQETCVVSQLEDNSYEVLLFIALSPFENHYQTTKSKLEKLQDRLMVVTSTNGYNLNRVLLKDLMKRYPSLGATQDMHPPGGNDQIMLYLLVEEAMAFIDEPVARHAIRKLNLTLSRKGPCNFVRSHCMDLADHLF